MSETAIVKAGVCGKTTRITATPSEDMMTVSVRMESDCPMVSKVPVIENIACYEEVGTPFNESVIYRWASENIRHTACPVPCGVVKCVEAAAGLGLKKPVSIEWERGHSFSPPEEASVFRRLSRRCSSTAQSSPLLPQTFSKKSCRSLDSDSCVCP